MPHRILFLLVIAGLFPAASMAAPPNFVFILVDDLGYNDIGAYNAATFYETPNVDRLAAEGMRFTNGYAANPVCSPTRFSIMTGRYPTRVGATDWFTGTRTGRFQGAPLNDRMPIEEVTLAEALKRANYRTAFVGKWHLGPSAEYWPETQGFDVNVAGHDRGSPPGGYFSPFKNPKLADGVEGEHLTARLADESIRILEQFQHDRFLLYLAFYTVHTPLQAPRELVEKYNAKGERVTSELDEFGPEEQVWPVETPRKVRQVQKHPTYAAMVESMDHHVGRVLDKLSELGLAENTVVCFTSDNGGLSTSEGSPTSNLPLRGGKGWVYEGGIREPFLIKWPGHTQPGSICDEPVISVDFFPTVVDIAGVDEAIEHSVDGRSLVPLLEGAREFDREAIFWHYPHYSNQGGFPGGAVRMGNYKLIERYEDGRVHLYDVSADIGEHLDLATEMPDRVDMMREKLHDWYRQTGAKFLRPLKDGPLPWTPY